MIQTLHWHAEALTNLNRPASKVQLQLEVVVQDFELLAPSRQLEERVEVPVG